MVSSSQIIVPIEKCITPGALIQMNAVFSLIVMGIKNCKKAYNVVIITLL